MPKSDQGEKRILKIDGVEVEGLVAIDEYTIEEDVISVPGRDKVVPVKNGVTKIPTINCTYKIKRDSSTLVFFQTWREQNQTKSCLHIRTDGAGREIARELWTNVECSKVNPGGYDAAAPDYAKIMITLLPEDIINLTAEG